MDADGKNDRPLVEFHSVSPQFLPDGRILFVNWPGNDGPGPHFGPNARICSVDARGEGFQVLHKSAQSISRVRASPDGKRMAFVTGGPYLWNVQVADADGSNARLLCEHARNPIWGRVVKLP